MMGDVSTEQSPTSSLDTQLETEKKRSEEYLTRLKYMQADLENLRKRCDRQVEDTKAYCTENLVSQLLEVVDELEIAIKATKASSDPQTILQGVEMTLKKLRKVLEQEGVSQIECEGQVFDPSKHHAIATEERKDIPDCVIVEEVRKGYMMKNKVIRPSIVKVATNSSKSQEENTKNE
jgi:molecular chaperone GrpE